MFIRELTLGANQHGMNYNLDNINTQIYTQLHIQSIHTKKKHTQIFIRISTYIIISPDTELILFTAS